MSAAVHLGEVVPFLDTPEPTEQKLGRTWAGQGATREPTPLSKDALLKAHGPETAYAPKWHTGSFRAPLGMRWPQFRALVHEQTTKWLEAMTARGFDVCSESRVDVVPGPYPARDLVTGLSLLGEREMLVRAQFRERRPTVRRVELPGALFSNSGEE